jgi:hypothetical protein
VALVAAALGLAAPCAALADGSPAFSVGPVKVKNGYTMTIFGYGCGTKYAGGSVSFSKSGHGWSESHTYSPRKPGSCRLASNLSSGSLKFTIGQKVKVNITFSKRGSAKRGSLPPGCTGQHPKIQGGLAKGTIKVNLSSFFGKLSKRQVDATVQNEPSYTCKPSSSFKKTYILSVSSGGEAGSVGLNASLPPSGPATISVFKSQPSADMFSSHELTLVGSRSMFKASSNLSSAKVKGSGKLQGTLTFKANPSCQGNGRTGTISGSLTAAFDVGGKQTIKPTTPPPYAVLSRDETRPPCQ